MKKIRIGMFSWESLYSIRVGGISPHVSEISEALVAEGREVHLFTRGRDYSDEIINSVHYHRVSWDQNGGIVEQMNRMCDDMYLRFLEGLGRNRMGENGYDLLKNKYNWKKIAQKTLDIYDKLIEKRAL